jgi:hypothetical protein
MVNVRVSFKMQSGAIAKRCVFSNCESLRHESRFMLVGFRCFPQGSSLPNIAVASGPPHFFAALFVLLFSADGDAGIAVVLLVDTVAYSDSKHSGVSAVDFL